MGKETKIQDEQWYEALAKDLYQYRTYKARIGVLEARMIRQAGPSSRVLAAYGDITESAVASLDTDEAELEQLKSKVASIELALGALTDVERKIIELKYFERRKHIMIYEMFLPMAPNTFYKELDNALETIQKVTKNNLIKK